MEPPYFLSLRESLISLLLHLKILLIIHVSLGKQTVLSVAIQILKSTKLLSNSSNSSEELPLTPLNSSEELLQTPPNKFGGVPVFFSDTQ
jgi:hypothetical protein